MAQYSIVPGSKGDNPRYKDGNKFVAADNVPENVKTTLADAADGTVVDELGEPVNTETDTDESEDETPPTTTDEDADEGDDNTQTTPPEEHQERPRRAEINETGTPQSDEGMGFKRSKGKTLSIFSNKPHETVKNVNGTMVPMTHEEYAEKTDAEIMEKLRSLKKTA